MAVILKLAPGAGPARAAVRSFYVGSPALPTPLLLDPLPSLMVPPVLVKCFVLALASRLRCRYGHGKDAWLATAGRHSSRDVV